MPLDLAAEYQSSGYPLMGSSDKAPEPESAPELNPPKRIGDLPPVPYIDNTFNVLSSRHEKFCDELGALSRDIEKLVTERNQLTIAIDAIEAAKPSMYTVFFALCCLSRL